MPRQQTIAPVCPSADELSAFDRGLLPAERMSNLVEHVSHCPGCLSSLEALQRADTVWQRLRTSAPPPAEEAGWARLAERARAIPREAAAGLTVTEAGTTAVAEKPALPAVFGPYLLLEEIGQGGMGVVFKARQEKLNRLVALKLVRAGAYAGREERARFQREGEAVARVRHANVVQVHDFGEHQGQPYFSMELLEGGTLAARLRDRPLPEREAAGLVAALARAVEAAHREGIVHRDLKPGNVLFAADGTPKVTDFGLAKMLDADSTILTIDHAILGTPAYMAPEQARGDSRDIGRAVDVYALGAILYEALTGRPPFAGATRSRTLELVRTAEPEPPSRHRRGLAADLEAICLKCLEKQPDRRYPSAAELADDLERWLRGEPTKARPPGRLARLGRAVRRRPRTAAALLLLAVLGLTGSLAWVRMDPDRPRRNIEERLKRGQSVVLIGDKGKPLWYAFAHGGEKAQVSEDPKDGTFTVHSWSETQLELLRDPQHDSYRLRAEVRYRAGESHEAMGLYVLHRSFAVPQGRAHSLFRWTFNEKYDGLKRHEEAKQLFKQRTGRELQQRPPPAAGQVRLDYDLFLDKPGPGPWGTGVFVGCAGMEPAIRTRKWDWRQLAVEVTPHGLRGFWEGQMVYERSFENITNDLRRCLHARSADPQSIGPSPDQHDVVLQLSPRSRLGLYVMNASASFRRVVVEPLEGE